MNKKLSKLETLEWTWIIWRDVAASLEYSNTPEKIKAGVCASYGKSFLYNCPCCQYSYDKDQAADGEDRFCQGVDCLLKSVWGSTTPFACEWVERSPYRAYYRTAKRIVKLEAAQKIADGTWKLYVKECKFQNVEPGDKFFMPIADSA